MTSELVTFSGAKQWTETCFSIWVLYGFARPSGCPNLYYSPLFHVKTEAIFDIDH